MNGSRDMQMISNVLIVSVPDDLDVSVLQDLKGRVLHHVNAYSIRKVVVDISAREILDAYGFSFLEQSGQALRLLGAEVLFVGFQPGVVSALINLDVDIDQIPCAASVDDALALFAQVEEVISEEDVEGALDETENDDSSEPEEFCSEETSCAEESDSHDEIQRLV